MDPEAEAALQSTLGQLAHLRIEPSRLTITNDLEVGNGGYGEVCLATLDGRRKVAVKQLRIIKATGTQVRVAMRLARELKTWSKAQHPNVLKLVGYYLSENYDCAQLVSSYLPNGNITDYIKRKKPGTEARLGFARGVTSGMAYLHKSNPPICHGDLKPANVLISDKLEAVLCDFGLATFVQNSGTPSRSGLTTSAALKGSTRYMSPELFLKDEAKQTLESDVWAWACTVFEIITDTVPYPAYEGAGQIILALTCGTPPGSLELLKRPALDVDMPLRSTLDALRHLVPKCWSSNPDKRPSFSMILDSIERGLGNPPSDLSREESPQQPSLTQEDISYFDELLSRTSGNHSILGSPTGGAPPAGNARKASAQPEALPTTSSTSSAYQENLIDFSFDFLDQSNSSISQFTAVPTEQATPATEHLDQGRIFQDDLEALLFDMDGECGAPIIGDTLDVFTPPLRLGQAIETPPTEPVKQDHHPVTDPDVTITPKMGTLPAIREAPTRRPTVQDGGLTDIRSGSMGSSPPKRASPPLPNPTPPAPQSAPHSLPSNAPSSSGKPVDEVPKASAPDTPMDSESVDDLSTRNGASVTPPRARPSVKRQAKAPPPPPKVNEASVLPSPDLDTGSQAAPKRAPSSRNPPSNPRLAPVLNDSNPHLDPPVGADVDSPSTLDGTPAARPRAHPSISSSKVPRPPQEASAAPNEAPVLPSPGVGLSPYEAPRKLAPANRKPSSNPSVAPALGNSHPHPGHPAVPAPTHLPTRREDLPPISVPRNPPEVLARSGSIHGAVTRPGLRAEATPAPEKKSWFSKLFCCC